ncbi:hypothetical protein EV424DRAFT_33852 [Suillus variegatus]|nr:hypothetical protein EV424DRAFT_33852 [Suillus variegatus]
MSVCLSQPQIRNITSPKHPLSIPTMQLTLIFTTLLTFAAIATSHPTPNLVKKRLGCPIYLIHLMNLTRLTLAIHPCRLMSRSTTTASFTREAPTPMTLSPASLIQSTKAATRGREDVGSYKRSTNSHGSESCVAHSIDESDISDSGDMGREDIGSHKRSTNSHDSESCISHSTDESADTGREDIGSRKRNTNSHDSESCIAHSTDESSDTGHEDVGSHRVHKRKAFVYRLKDEKRYN